MLKSISLAYAGRLVTLGLSDSSQFMSSTLIIMQSSTSALCVRYGMPNNRETLTGDVMEINSLTKVFVNKRHQQRLNHVIVYNANISTLQLSCSSQNDASWVTIFVPLDSIYCRWALVPKSVILYMTEPHLLENERWEGFAAETVLLSAERVLPMFSSWCNSS